MKKCVHVLGFDDYQTEMCAYTLPLLQKYADRIKADFRRIRTRKFPDYPINYERMQVYETGINYDWNIVLDVDLLLHPSFPDPSEVMTDDYVTSETSYAASREFYVERDSVFSSDKRDLGLVDNIIISTRKTHQLWQPLVGDFTRWGKLCKNNPRLVSELCVSYNLAKHKLKYINGIVTSKNYFHVGVSSNRVQNPVKLILNQMKAWNINP